MKNNFPRIIIAATQSGAGKTTITVGLIAALKNRGLNVQSYKTGPDYIDTGWHQSVNGKPSHNLDSWLVGKDNIKNIFANTAKAADISIIEGVMGLYDGGRNGISSTAEISKLLGIPVVLVIDAQHMGTSAAAIALGFREFDKSVNFAGMILNRIGSDSHRDMIIDALDKLNIKCFGAIRRDMRINLPERHLGLLPTSENQDGGRLQRIAEAVESQIDIGALIDIAKSAAPIETVDDTEKILPRVKIGVAYDKAFNFYYETSLAELEKLGAQIIYFSPLNDKHLPDVDGLLIGGGFPEMFAEQLEQNESLRREIHDAADKGMPIFAECGGFMYLMNRLIDFSGKKFDMCDVFDGFTIMNRRLQSVGYVDAEILHDCIIGKRGDKVHTHEFHFSSEIGTTPGENIFLCTKLRTGDRYSAGLIRKNVVGSYLHIHFTGCPDIAKNFVDSLIDYHNSK
ncbi:MAG: cobyrinate a,c-diamide synthase [Selenomonadaceae bacterium]|nr:cobyrinate a,c-diamide synthase [Selenomonadaceae bacterium]